MLSATAVQWVLTVCLILSALGTITTTKPVRSCLFFLCTLLALAAIYADLSAEFIAVMQILIYAGAILVIYMFVIILFQNAYAQIENYPPKSSKALLAIAGSIFFFTLLFLGYKIIDIEKASVVPEENFGTVQALGYDLYLNFIFPFEAIVIVFLIAVVGTIYIGKREEE